MNTAGKMRFAAFIMAPLGIGMIIGAIWTGINAKSFIDNALKGEGVVIKMERRESGTGSDRSITYAPVFTFKDKKDESHMIHSSTSSSPPAYEVNEKVEVLYLAEQPEEAKLNGFFSLWGIPLVLGIIGIMDLLMSVVFFIIALRKA